MSDVRCQRPINVIAVAADNEIRIDITEPEGLHIDITQESEELINAAAQHEDEVIDVKWLSETINRSGHSPYINEDTGTWWQFDDELQVYYDTKVKYSDAGVFIPITNDKIFEIFSKYN